jgi:hypothetical protein
MTPPRGLWAISFVQRFGRDGPGAGAVLQLAFSAALDLQDPDTAFSLCDLARAISTSAIFDCIALALFMGHCRWPGNASHARSVDVRSAARVAF